MPANSLWLNTPSSGALLLNVSWTEISYDINTNTSTVAFGANLQNPHGYTMYSGYNQIHFYLVAESSSLESGWGSWVVGTKYVPSTPANSNDVISYTYNIPHRPDGTLSINCFAVFEPNGATARYIPGAGRVDAGWAGATTIPRASAVNNHAFGEDWTTGYSINYTPLVASYSHKVRISIPNVIEIYKADNYQNGSIITLPKEVVDKVWEYTKDKNEVTMGIVLETWNGASKIGESAEYTKKYSVIDPIDISYTIEEISSLKNKGVGPTDFVSLIGSKRMSVTASCAHSKIYLHVECGGYIVDKVEIASGTTKTFEFSNLQSANYKLYATNGRPGYTKTAVNSVGNLVNYFRPSIIYSKVKRLNDTSDRGLLEISSMIYSDKIGTYDTTKCKYKIIRDGSNVVTSIGNISNNRFTLSYPITNVPYKKSFLYTVELEDALGYTTIINLNLPPTAPVFSIGKKQVNINHVLKLGEDTSPGVIAYSPYNGHKIGKALLTQSTYPTQRNWFKIAEFKWVKDIMYECKGTIGSSWSYEEFKLRILDDKGSLIHTPTSSYYYGSYRYGLQIVYLANKNVELWYHINGGVNTECVIDIDYNQNILSNAYETNKYAYNNIKVLGEFDFKYLNSGQELSAIQNYKFSDSLYNKLLMTMPIGTIIINDNNNFDPFYYYGGKWEKIEDRFLIGASKNTPIKSQGGSFTHSHGNLDGRNGNLAAAIGATNNNPNVIGYKAANDTNIGALGNATYVVAGTSIGFGGWNHFTAVVGQTASDTTAPPYYAVNFWKRIE